MRPAVERQWEQGQPDQREQGQPEQREQGLESNVGVFVSCASSLDYFLVVSGAGVAGAGVAGAGVAGAGVAGAAVFLFFFLRACCM